MKPLNCSWYVVTVKGPLGKCRWPRVEQISWFCNQPKPFLFYLLIFWHIPWILCCLTILRFCSHYKTISKSCQQWQSQMVKKVVMPILTLFLCLRVQVPQWNRYFCFAVFLLMDLVHNNRSNRQEFKPPSFYPSFPLLAVVHNVCLPLFCRKNFSFYSNTWWQL